MMQFNVAGIFLDLYADFDLQFARKNILFAFDEIECSRTATFDVPATPKNNNIFQLANNEAKIGEQARAKIDAQLQYSGGAVDGYLYVTTCDHDKYSCIFVYGELVKLQALKDAGKIGDFMQFTETETLGRFEEDCTQPLPFFAAVPYKNGHAIAPNPSDRTSYQTGYFPLPSWNLREMIDQCLTELGITLDTTEAPILDDIRVTIAKPQIETAATSVIFEVTQNVITGRIDSPYITKSERFIVFKRGNIEARWTAAAFNANTNVKITFAADFPDLFMIRADSDPRSIIFLGGYSCDRDGVTSGNPLAGREITIEKGDFMFATSDMIERDRNDYGLNIPQGDYTYYGTADVQAVGAIGDTGATIYLQENLPDMTIVDLLKTAAAVSGTFLYWEEDTLYFVSDIDPNLVMSLDRLVSLKDIRRTFGDYGQTNEIVYAVNESDDNNNPPATYNIYNVNITKYKELLKIPFSRGSRVESFQSEEVNPIDVEIRDIYMPDPYTHEYPNEYGSLIYCNQNYYAEPLPDMPNATLVSLTENATSIKVGAVMSLKDFNKINERQLLLCRGQLYVWTSATWQNGIAQLELSKIII